MTPFNIGVACTDAHLATPTAKRIAMIAENAAAPGGASSITFAELAAQTSRFAQALRHLDVEAGARVMIRLPNCLAYPIVFLGALKRGAIPVPSAVQLTAAELIWLLDDAGAAVLATDAASWARLAPDLTQAGRRAAALRHVIVTDDRHPARFGRRWDRPAVHSLEALLAANGRCAVPCATDTDADDPAYLVYTSGSSGYPKGVLHAHRALWGRRPAMRAWFDFQENERVLHSGRLNWTYVLGTALMDPLSQGQTAIVCEGPPDAAQWIPRIARLQATTFIGVPTIYRQILQKTHFTAADAPTLRHCMCAGEHLSDEVLRGWRARFGQEIYEAIGMSECSYYLSQRKGLPVRPGSVGMPQPGHLVGLLDDDLNQVPNDVVGQLAIREDDPGLFLRYWNRPEETARLRRNGWFLTGDYARRDADGYFWFMGRRDDILKSFGYRVSPFEVERVLKDHPAVADCAVVGEEVGPDKTIIAAYVLLAAGHRAGAGEIIAFAGERLASYKCPRLVHFVADLPRTANGKILRRLLRDPSVSSQ